MRGLKVLGLAVLVGCGSSGTDAGSGSKGSPRWTITVTVAGAGAVSGAGLSGCRGSCTFIADDGAAIELTAAPDPGTAFSGWSGACSGTGSCAFKAAGDAQAMATFAPVAPPPVGKHNLLVSKNGSGAVRSTPAGIDCGSICAAALDDGAIVSLAATPDANFRFAGWGGACSGGGGCSVALHADATVYATFEAIQPVRHTLTVSRAGNGRVTSSPAGIDCGGPCSASFDKGQVDLTAAPDVGWTFAGWGGACSGTSACSVSLSNDVIVSASFTASPPPPDECAGLAPTAPGAPLKVRVATSSGPTCHAGNADGQGNLALVYDLAGSLFAQFFDGSGKALGKFILHDEALPVSEQVDGYLVLGGRARAVQWLTASGQVGAETSAEYNFNGLMDDPTGGAVVATASSIAAYDAQAALRW